MNWTNLKAYFKFLSRNKLYTFVTIFGFSVSLMFVLILSTYIRQELSVDGFHEKKDRIYIMTTDHQMGAYSYLASFANPVADVIKEKCPEVEAYTRLVSQQVTVALSDEKVMAEALYADSAFFNIFTFPLQEGNPNKVLETKHSAVLSQSFAKKIFPGEEPVGKYIKIDDIEVQVTGIMEDFPKNTHLPDNDLILNYAMIDYKWYEGILQEWGNSSFPVYFLAKEGADLPAKAPMLLEDFKENYWIYKDGFHTTLSFVKLQDIYFGGVFNYMAKLESNNLTTVYLYLSVAILILVIAVLNYINLSVSITVKRGKESAIKKLLGSSRKALFAQFISEAIVMSFIALLIGILFAFIAEPFFNNVLNTSLDLKEQFNFGYIAVVVLAILIIGLIAGLFPATIVSRFTPIEVVKGTFNRKVKSTYSKILITFQYVVTIVLLIYSSFILLQTRYMKNYDVGFDYENVYILDNVLNSEQLPGFRDKLMTIPGVDKVSFSAGNPLSGGNNSSYSLCGTPISLEVFTVDSAFMDLYRINYTMKVDPGTKNINLSNKAAIDLMQPDSVTYVVQLDGGPDNVHRISGIVDDFHYRPLDQKIGPSEIYIREMQWAWHLNIRFKEGADKYKTAETINNIYTDYSGGKLYSAFHAEDIAKTWYEKEEKTSRIMMAFTLLTIIILMMGMIAISLYYVRQKEKEIALRKIQGATEFEILKMINFDFIKRILLAFVIAVPIAWYLSNKFLQGFAYKINLSWWVFVGAGVIISILSVLFVTLQSWRAATSNPVDALKNE